MFQPFFLSKVHYSLLTMSICLFCSDKTYVESVVSFLHDVVPQASRRLCSILKLIIFHNVILCSQRFFVVFTFFYVAFSIGEVFELKSRLQIQENSYRSWNTRHSLNRMETCGKKKVVLTWLLLASSVHVLGVVDDFRVVSSPVGQTWTLKNA